MRSRAGVRYYRDAIALVTGAGSGIGEALANALAARGARVLLGDRRGEEAERVAARIRELGGFAEPSALDVREAAQVSAWVETARLRHGRIDLVFNNAGIGVAGEVRDLAIADWRAIVEVNLMGVVHGVHAAYPTMVAQGFGHLVNTASMSGLMPSPLTTPYGATKAGVVGLSRSLRVEAAHYGVRVTALCPGVVRTPILEGGAFGRFAKRPPEDLQRAAFEQMRPMDKDVFARRVLDALPRNPNTLVVPRWWRVVDLLNRLSPELGGALASLGFSHMKADFDRGEPQRPDPDVASDGDI